MNAHPHSLFKLSTFCISLSPLLSNNNRFAHHRANDVNHCYFAVKFVYTVYEIDAWKTRVTLTAHGCWCWCCHFLLYLYIYLLSRFGFKFNMNGTCTNTRQRGKQIEFQLNDCSIVMFIVKIYMASYKNVSKQTGNPCSSKSRTTTINSEKQICEHTHRAK